MFLKILSHLSFGNILLILSLLFYYGSNRFFGFLRDGRKGETYFTKDVYKSGTKAQERLALPNTPEYRVEFEIVNNPKAKVYGDKVIPYYGQPGKGSEFMTKDPVQVDIINYQPIHGTPNVYKAPAPPKAVPNSYLYRQLSPNE